MARGTIDELNFKVVLNDTGFKQQVNDDIALARRLNQSLTESLNLRKKLVVEERAFAKAATQTATAQQKAQAAIEKQAKGLTSSGISLNRAWLRFSATLWSIISVIRLFVRTLGQAIKNIADFQQANANLATIMQVSKQEIETLTNDALMLGRTTEWTASQVTELQTALAKLGYNIPQIQNMQASVLQFATAVGAKLPDAANLAGAALRMFGMHSSEMQKALEILTASTNKTALDFEKLKVALPYAGAIAHSIGFDIAETSALLGVLTNAGLASSRAGTGLRQVLLELSKQNGKLQTAMGGNIKTFDDFVRGLQLMRDRGLEAGEAAKLVSTRASSALLILANGVDDIKRLNEEVRDTDGLLKTIQADRLDTLHGSTLLLKSAWEGLIQTFRDSAGPMKDIVDWLTKIIRATSLAASRANRVAQGTKDVVGSDQLTKQFKEQYEGIIKNLVEDGMAPENAAKAAAKVVNESMQKWRDEAFAANTHDGIDEKGWYNFLTKSIPVVKWITKGATRKWRAKDEQVDAIDNAMSAMTDYMDNHVQEQAEIAANEYLDQWRRTFDEKGADAARAAADSLIRSFSGDADMKRRLIDMRASLEEYITGGGEGGARDRGKGPTALQIQNEAISDLKAEAQYIRRLADAYEQLQPYLGKDTNAKMVELFGAGDYSPEALEEQIKEIVADLKDLGDNGADAALALEQAWGLDKFSQALKQLKADKNAADEAQKSLKKYLDTMQEWADKNDVGQFSGAIKSYYKALSDADETAKGAASSLYSSTSDNNAILMGLARINGEWARARANALKTLNDDLEKHAEDYLKGELEKGGFDLTDWGDKTLRQINDIKDAIEGITISDDIKNALLLMPGGANVLAMLNAALEKIKQSKIDKTVDPERFKKIAKQAKYIAEQFLSVSKSLKDFADASGNQALSDAASRISAISQNIKAAYDGYKAAGPWGAAIGGFADLVNQALGGMTAIEQRAVELRESIRNIRIETETQSFKDALMDQANGIFGDNFIHRLKDAVRLLDEVRKNMAALEYEKPEWSFLGYKDEDMPDVERWNAIQRGRYGDMPFVTSHSWLTGDKSKTLEELAKEFGLDMYDENNFLNPKLLQAVLDTYGDLNEGAKDWLTSSIQYAEQYAEAMQAVEDATKDIFNDLASDMTDKFIDNFMKMGNAVDDLSDTFADLGDAILRSFLQSYILDEILNKYSEKAKGALSKYANGEMTPEEYAAWLDGFADNVQKESEALAPAINGMIEAFKDRGLMNIDEETSGSLGSGIKSITEETAGLLASYINAIRADVSYIRSMYESGFEGVAELGAALPTLNDYLAQIAATNYDTAQNTQRILSELQSVIGAPGTSGMVVRVEAS